MPIDVLISPRRPPICGSRHIQSSSSWPEPQNTVIWGPRFFFYFYFVARRGKKQGNVRISITLGREICDFYADFFFFLGQWISAMSFSGVSFFSFEKRAWKGKSVCPNCVRSAPDSKLKGGKERENWGNSRAAIWDGFVKRGKAKLAFWLPFREVSFSARHMLPNGLRVFTDFRSDNEAAPEMASF